MWLYQGESTKWRVSKKIKQQQQIGAVFIVASVKLIEFRAVHIVTDFTKAWCPFKAWYVLPLIQKNDWLRTKCSYRLQFLHRINKTLRPCIFANLLSSRVICPSMTECKWFWVVGIWKKGCIVYASWLASHVCHSKSQADIKLLMLFAATSTTTAIATASNTITIAVFAKTTTAAAKKKKQKTNKNDYWHSKTKSKHTHKKVQKNVIYYDNSCSVIISSVPFSRLCAWILLLLLLIADTRCARACVLQILLLLVLLLLLLLPYIAAAIIATHTLLLLLLLPPLLRLLLPMLLLVLLLLLLLLFILLLQRGGWWWEGCV